MMKRLTILCLLLFVMACGQAAPHRNYTLSKLSFLLEQQAWLTTAEPLVSVQVKASVQPALLASLTAGVRQKLNQLAKADWHITRFTQTGSDSGLANVDLLAEARVPAKQLQALTQQAKKISVSGEQYRIDNISYQATAAEIATMQAQLRSKIYAQAQAQAADLNKSFPGRHYQIYHVNFLPGLGHLRDNAPRLLTAMANVSSPVTNDLAIDQKVTVSARVTLATAFKPLRKP